MRLSYKKNQIIWPIHFSQFIQFHFQLWTICFDKLISIMIEYGCCCCFCCFSFNSHACKVMNECVTKFPVFLPLFCYISESSGKCSNYFTHQKKNHVEKTVTKNERQHKSIKYNQICSCLVNFHAQTYHIQWDRHRQLNTQKKDTKTN